MPHEALYGVRLGAVAGGSEISKGFVWRFRF